MAAYASLVILAKNIHPIHGDLIHAHRNLDLKPLYETVVQLQSIMKDCPGDTLSQEFQARIRDFGYTAIFFIEARYIRYMEGWNKQNHKKARYKLRKLTDKATSLVAEAQNLRGVVVTKDPVMQMKESSSSVYAPGDAKRKVRLYSDTTKLEERLYAGSSPRQVIPIVGMGGSGKTTLANVMFNDSRTRRRFDRRVWLTVSSNYDKCTLLSQILRDLKESTPETYGDLVEKVYKCLKGRRYLAVIDDIWSEKLWDDINIFLPDEGNGSRILLTTRLVNVANYVLSSNYYDESYIHMAELMDLDSSWRLLKDTVFGQNGDCPVELEGIGRSIAQDCCGLPLAIVVVAGVLSSTNNKKEFWEKIAANVKTTTKSYDFCAGIEKVLYLSYVNLPHHLKPCFLCLACFPEDYEIKVFELITLWIAEGFVKPNQPETCEVERVAYEYLDDLVWKNLVLVSNTDYNDEISSIRLHDMVRDLCVKIAQKENFMCRFLEQATMRRMERKYDSSRFLPLMAADFVFPDLLPLYFSPPMEWGVLDEEDAWR